jgi:hypothetical protein
VVAQGLTSAGGRTSQPDATLTVQSPEVSEEESSSDTDYFIDSNTVDFLADAGGSVPLLLLLREAVGNSDGVDIGWQDA